MWNFVCLFKYRIHTHTHTHTSGCRIYFCQVFCLRIKLWLCFCFSKISFDDNCSLIVFVCAWPCVVFTPEDHQPPHQMLSILGCNRSLFCLEKILSFCHDQRLPAPDSIKWSKCAQRLAAQILSRYDISGQTAPKSQSFFCFLSFRRSPLLCSNLNVFFSSTWRLINLL